MISSRVQAANSFSCPFLPARAPLHLRLRHRPLHLLLPAGERRGARLRQDGVLARGPRLQERHRRQVPPGGHVDHLHEGPTQLLALRRDPLLLQRAAEHLLPARTGPHLRHLHHQRVSVRHTAVTDTHLILLQFDGVCFF